jgi:dUTP pyrophosphatase
MSLSDDFVPLVDRDFRLHCKQYEDGMAANTRLESWSIGSTVPSLTLAFKRLSATAILPTRSHPQDAAFDLYTPATIILRGTNPVTPIHLGIAWSCPPGWYAQILGRSGLAIAGIVPVGGVIDCSYRKEWIVLMARLDQATRRFDAGDRVAQFVLHRVPDVTTIEVAELDATDRGAGFGSSGR